MCALLDHRRSHRLSVRGDLALLVFATRGQQLRVQLREIPRLGHRHPVVPAKIAGLIFNSALLVWFLRRAEFALKSPVRAEGDEARGLLPAMTPQDLLHRTFQIV